MTAPDTGTRLPVPDWDRPGETWRVEPESGQWTTHVAGMLCEADHGQCLRPAAAALRNRRGEPWPNCAVHLTKGRMWVENGQVVSWVLRP